MEGKKEKEPFVIFAHISFRMAFVRSPGFFLLSCADFFLLPICPGMNHILKEIEESPAMSNPFFPAISSRTYLITNFPRKINEDMGGKQE